MELAWASYLLEEREPRIQLAQPGVARAFAPSALNTAGRLCHFPWEVVLLG